MRSYKFTDYINPVINALKELGGSARPKEVYQWIAEKLNLPDKILNEQNKSGGSKFENQVAWARFYLSKAGYIDSSKRGVWALTEKGLKREKFSETEVENLVKKVNELSRKKTSDRTLEENRVESEDISPPTEFRSYKEELLEVIKNLSPKGFERLCQRLLREAGFQEVKITGRSGDGGIDGIGILQVNPFVSFKVIFQCKKYSGSVASPQIRDFRGAMMGRADKGIILTTGTFTADAKREAVRDGVPPIELVDGDDLVSLFEQLELGLRPRVTYDVDYEFFKEFEDY